MDTQYTITRGDTQRLPSTDDEDWFTLKDPTTDTPIDLSDREATFILSTRAVGGERIELANEVVYGDRSAGECAITLDSTATSLPQGYTTPLNLVGEWRITGSESDDPTTVGRVDIRITNSLASVTENATVLSTIHTLADLAPFDFGDKRLRNVSTPEAESDAVPRSWVSSQLSALSDQLTGLLSTHTADTENPHEVTAEDVGAISEGESVEFNELSSKVINGSEVNAGWFDTYDEARQFAVDNGYGKIYVPAGEYNEKCDVPDGVQVYGDGYATWFNSPGKGGSVGNNGILRRIRLSTGTGQLDDALDPVGSGAVIQDVVISHAQRFGILVRGSNDTYITGVRFENQIENTGVQYFSSSENNIINHCWVAGGIDNSGDNIVGDEIVYL